MCVCVFIAEGRQERKAALPKRSKFWVMRPFALAIAVAAVDAYPSYLPCSRTLTVGTTIMGSSATSSSSGTVEFRRNGVAVTSTYTPGEVRTCLGSFCHIDA